MTRTPLIRLYRQYSHGSWNDFAINEVANQFRGSQIPYGQMQIGNGGYHMPWYSTNITKTDCEWYIRVGAADVIFLRSQYARVHLRHTSLHVCISIHVCLSHKEAGWDNGSWKYTIKLWTTCIRRHCDIFLKIVFSSLKRPHTISAICRNGLNDSCVFNGQTACV